MIDHEQRITAKPVTLTDCDGIRRVGPLGFQQIVGPAAGDALSGVVRAYDEARAAASMRCRGLVEGPAVSDAAIPAADVLIGEVRRAVRTAQRELTIQRRTELGGIAVSQTVRRTLPYEDDQVLDVLGGAVAGAYEDGAITLLNVDRNVEAIGDVVDDLTMVFRSPTVATAVVGTAPRSSVRCGNLAVVWACGTDVRVRSVDGSQELTVPSGTSAPFEQFGDVEVGSGGVALVVAVNRVTRKDVRTVCGRKATGSPRLRGDVPIDLLQPSSSYGYDGLVDPIQYFNAAIDEVYGPGAEAEALRWWAATLRSSRGASDLLALPAAVAEWPDALVRGALLGGIGVVLEDGSRRLLAFAGEIVDVDEHLLPLLERVASGHPFVVNGEPPLCPNGDPHCARRAIRELLQLGVVVLA